MQLPLSIMITTVRLRSSMHLVLLALIQHQILLCYLLEGGVGKTIHCYCDMSHNVPVVDCVSNNFQCISTLGCYYRKWSDGHRAINHDWGCIRDSHLIDYYQLYCGSWDTPTDVSRCCNTSDLCNQNLRIPPLPAENEHLSLVVSQSISPSPRYHANNSSRNIDGILAISFTIPLIIIPTLILLVILLLVYVRLRKRRLILSQHHTTASVYWTNQGLGRVVGLSASKTDERDSDSLPYQVLGNIEDIVKLNYQLEIGRFGVFYHGHYDGIEVTLKKFSEKNRTAWLRESLLYIGVIPPHENILSFFVSAMTRPSTDSAAALGSELWLVTKYHKYGSLQDYLRQNTVPARVLLQMSASVASGLAHLHSESSCNLVKLPLAHCHLTSRNILVKENLSCVIGDFRLAVFKQNGEIYYPDKTRGCNVVRYMAPEMLSHTQSELSFENFKQADVYSLGLVLWEICQRGHCSGVSAEAYQVPFQGLVPPEPSVEDMKRLVVTEKVQPTISSRWSNNKLLREMTKVMKECWYYTSTARPTAVYLKKKLLKMSQELENTDIMPNTDDASLCKKEMSNEEETVYVTTI